MPCLHAHRGFSTRWLFAGVCLLLAPSHAVLAEQNGQESSDEPSITDDQPVRPPVFDCERVTWMDNCKAINQQYQNNPNEHIQVETRRGLELNLPPETPTAAIRHFVEETPEAAEAYARYLDQIMQHSLDAADRLSAAQDRIGVAGETAPAGSVSSDEIAQAEGAPENLTNRQIADAGVQMYLFYGDDCRGCEETLASAAALQDSFDALFISPLQMSDSGSLLASVESEYGLDARMVSGDAYNEWNARLDDLPTILIETERMSRQLVIEGAVSEQDLRKAIANAISVSEGA